MRRVPYLDRRTRRWLTTRARSNATITRRNAMQAGAGAVLASGVPLFWWRVKHWADKAKIDAVLNGAVSSGNVPGVVAIAADDKGIIYEGAFGKRNWHRRGDDAGHGVLDRLDDQGDHLDRRHAAGRAGQARARSADRRALARARRAAGARRLRCRRQAAAAAGQAADHAAPPADPHRGLRLRHLERGHGPLQEGRPASRASARARTRR